MWKMYTKHPINQVQQYIFLTFIETFEMWLSFDTKCVKLIMTPGCLNMESLICGEGSLPPHYSFFFHTYECIVVHHHISVATTQLFTIRLEVIKPCELKITPPPTPCPRMVHKHTHTVLSGERVVVDVCKELKWAFLLVGRWVELQFNLRS